MNKVVVALIAFIALACAFAMHRGAAGRRSGSVTQLTALNDAAPDQNSNPTVAKRDVASVEPSAQPTANKRPNSSNESASQNLEVPVRPNIEALNEFLDNVIIGDLGETMKQAKFLSATSSRSPNGVYRGKVLFGDSSWDLSLARKAGDDATSDDFVEITDEKSELIYRGDGQNLKFMYEIPNSDQGFIVNCGSRFYLQIYDIDGGAGGRLAGNLYINEDGAVSRFGTFTLDRE